MSAVVEFVSNLAESVVDAVGDVVESVVDVVEKAVEFVGDTVQAVIDDPLPTLISIAGAFVGIPPMVTNAAITAARGGDLGDIALSVGTAYFAPTVTNSISSTLSASIGDALINETVSNVVVDGISKGLVNGTISEIKGGDFEDGFAGGFTGTVVGAGVGEVSDFVNESIFEELPDMGKFGEYAERAVTSGLTAEITGRGSFDTAFTNSVINSTANLGADYAVSAIGDQFNNTAKTNQEVEGAGEGDKVDYMDLTGELDDSWANTTGLVGTGAGLPDELVEEVEPSSIGQQTPSTQDDPMLTEAIAKDSGLMDYDQSDTSGDSSLAAIEKPEDVSDLAVEYGQEPVIGVVPDVAEDVAENVATDDQPLESTYKMPDLEEPVAPEAKQADIYDELTGNLVAPVAEGSVSDIGGGLAEFTDVSGKPLSGLQTSLTQDTGTAGKAVVKGALNQFLRPAIRQGITQTLRRPTARPTARPPARVAPPAAPKKLSATQMAAMQSRAPAQKVDVSTLTPKKKPVAQKVDVSKLSPITDITGLSAILAGGKGKG